MKLFMLDLAGKSVRKVEIYHDYQLKGFKFFDQNRDLILEVGYTGDSMTELVLEENERIVGLRASKHLYSDF
jgi:hypothetical protein